MTKQKLHWRELARKQKRTTRDTEGDQQMAAPILGGEDRNVHAGTRARDNPPSMIMKTCMKTTHPNEDSQAQSEPATAPEVEIGGGDHGYPPCPR
jgi:hypothetical protein